MDITPAIRIACSGGLGYLFGIATKNNPKIIALTWSVAEITIQIFKQLDFLHKNQLERPLRLIIGGLACLYLSEHRLISNVTQAILSLTVFYIVPEILTPLSRKIVIVFN